MPTIRVLAHKYKNDLTSMMRLSCAVLSTKVVTRTPVDTGTARASWNPTNGLPAASNVYITADNPNAKRNEISNVINSIMVGDSYSLTNGLPYIRRLEYESWSAQASAGMVRRSVAEWDSIVNEAVRKTRK